MSVYRHATADWREILIEDGTDGRVLVKITDQRGGDYRSITLPADERRAAAQALAGDEWRVVVAAEYDTDFDGWKEVSRREAIRQADHFHAELIQTLGANDGLRREVDDLRERLKHENETLRAEVTKLRKHRDELRQRISDNAHARLYESAQPDRPEPVDPASVRVGQVVEIEADDGSWMVRGECSEQLDNVGYLGLHIDSTRVVWISVIDDATVRVLHRAEPEPDSAAVEALADLIAELAASGVVADKPNELARALARCGVHVEVPNDG